MISAGAAGMMKKRKRQNTFFASAQPYADSE